MEKKYVFEGQYTSLKNNDTDAFLDVAGILIKGFEFKQNNKIGKKNKHNYLICGHYKTFVVFTEKKTVFAAKMFYCEKILCESVLRNDSKLNMAEPMRRVFKYKMELIWENNAGEHMELFDKGVEVLKNIR